MCYPCVCPTVTDVRVPYNKLGNLCDDDDDNDGVNDGDEVKAGTDPLVSDTTSAPCDTSTDTTGEKTAGTDGSTDPKDLDTTTEDPCAQLVSTLKSAAFEASLTTVTDVDPRFRGVNPANYSHSNPSDTGGSFGSGNPPDALGSLNGSDFSCGDYVHYFTQLEVVEGSGTYEFSNSFARTTSSSDEVGFSSIGEVFLDDTVPAGVTVAHTESITSTHVVATITVSGLEPGDVVIVRVSAQLYCNTDDAGGQIQARFVGLGGDQTVGLSNAGGIQLPNVLIDKTAAAPSVLAGSPITFTVTVTNTGDAEATGVGFTDPLPVTGFVWTFVGTPPGGCGISTVTDPATETQTLSCSGIALAAETGTLSVPVTSDTGTTSAACGPYDNTATLTGDYTGSAGASTTVQCFPSVSLAKTVTPDDATIAPGEVARFTITATNSGLAEATGVSFEDELPDGLSWSWTENGVVSPVDPKCDTTTLSGFLTCDEITIAAGGSFVVVLTATTATDSTNCGPINNTVSLTSNEEPNDQLGDNTASITVECTPSVDLSKTASPDTIVPGDALTFTITVTNNGSAAAPGVSFDDGLPAVSADPGEEWHFVGTDPTECTISEPAEFTGIQTLTCTGIDLDAGGDSFSVTVTILTSESPDDCGDIPNTANLTGETYTETTEEQLNNTATVTVNCAPELVVRKTPDTGAANAGDLISFTIEVINLGTADATNVDLDDTLPSNPGGLVWAFPATDAWEDFTSCTLVTNVLHCDADSIPPGGSAEVTVQAQTGTTSAACGDVTNPAATASADNADSDTDDIATITVSCSPKVDLSKSPTTNSDIAPGGNLGFTITVTNTGSAAAPDVEFSDPLPAAGLDWNITSTVPVGIDCDIDDTTRILTCSGIDLGPDGDDFSVTVTSATGTTLDFCGLQSNTASLTGTTYTETGEELDNNTASTTIVCTIDFSITKDCPSVDDLSGAGVGDPIYYQVTVHNDGDVDLPITVTDSRNQPPGSDNGYFVASHGSSVESNFPGTIPAGTDETRWYRGTITTTDAALGNVNNAATLTVAGFTPETANAGGGEGCAYTPVTTIEITKSCPESTDGLRVGNNIVYTIRIENTGDLPLSSIDVTEERAGVGANNGFDPALPTTLASGAFYEGTFTTQVTSADAGLGSINNHIEVTAFVAVTSQRHQELASLGGVPVEPDVSDTDDANCPFTPVTDFTVAKGCPETAEKRVDDQIIYPVTITNTGDVDVTITTLGETRSGTFYSDLALTTVIPATGASITVVPGTPVTIYFVDTITRQDAGNSNIDNTVTVTGQVQIGTGDPTVLDSVEADAMTGGTTGCPYEPFVDYTFSKNCPVFANGNAVGATIVYTVTVENTGDVDLTGLTVTDSRDPDGAFYEDAAGTTASNFPTTISPDDGVITRYYVTTIQTEDASAGNAVNAATIDANEIEASTTSAGSEAGCPFTSVTGVTITKSCPTFDEGVTQPRKDDNITYIVTIENIGDVEVTDLAVTDLRTTGSFVEAIPGTLAARATLVLTFVDTIQQSDIDTGTLNNSATVTGKISIGTVEPVVTDVSETANTAANNGETGCLFTPVSGIEITKSCPDSTTGLRVGDTITYQIRIENTGDLPLSSIDVTESRTGDGANGGYTPALPTTLEPGVVYTGAFATKVTDADVGAESINNRIDVTANVGAAQEIASLIGISQPDPETVSDFSIADCPFTPVTGFTVTKACPAIAEGARTGDKIYYPITITNTGDVELSLNDGDIDDVRTGAVRPSADDTGTVPYPLTVPPVFSDDDNFITVFFETKILPSDAENGNVDNSVTVTVDGVSQTAVAMSGGSEGCAFIPVTGFTVTKSCPVTDGKRVDDQIVYRVTIINSGDVDVSITTLDETRDGTFYTSPSDFTEANEVTGAFTVVPGPVVRIYFVDTIDGEDAAAGNVNNTVTVTGEVQVGSGDPTELAPVEADAGGAAGCTYTPVTGFTVAKGCPDTTGLGVDSQIIYPVTITNTGDVDLSITELGETRTGTFYRETTLDTVISAADPDFTVEPGIPVKFYFVDTIDGQDAINGHVNNEVTVTGTVTIGEGTTTLEPVIADAMTGDAVGCPFTPDTGIEITKTCPTVEANTRVGATIIYPITITNTGEVPLTGIDVNDDGRLGTFHSDVAAETTALAMPLVGVTLEPAGEVGDETTIYFKTTITPTDAANGNVDNSVDVDSATIVGGSELAVQDSGSTETCPFNPFEQVTITKTCPTITSGTRVGASITYDVTIENTGDVPLTNIVVTDEREGTFSADFPTTLDPDDEPVTRTFTSAITEQDAQAANVDNSATVTADATSGETVTKLDETIDQECPFDPFEDVTITKDCPTIADDARKGDWITYKVTLSNSGDVALSNVVVSEDPDRTGSFFLNASDDPETATASPFPGSLPVDDPATTGDDEGTVVRYYKTKITEADVSGFNVNNTVSVTANAVVGAGEGQVTTQVDDSFTAECDFNPVEGVAITKSCPEVADFTRVGTTIIYQVTITNTGDVTLDTITVSDNRVGGTFHTDPAAATEALTMPLDGVTLAPDGEAGDSLDLYFKSTITYADALAGNIDNTATVSADAGEALVQEQSIATGEACQFAPFVDVDISKTCPEIADGARVGEDITYDVTITNLGDVPLDITSVTDDRGDGFESAFPATLAPSGFATRTFTDQITHDDAANGNVNNIVTVNTGQGVSETFDTAVYNDATGCLYTPVTGIEITKSCPIITAGARIDDPISYTITVSNTGDVELSNIVVTDSRDTTWSETIPSLAPAGLPGDSTTVTFTSAITLTDAANGNVDNTANVVADIGPAAQEEIASLMGVPQEPPSTVRDSYNTATDGEGCPFTPVSDIEISKGCPTVAFGTRVDDQIVYEITLSNAGDIPLTVDNVLETRSGTLYTDAGLTTTATFPIPLAPETQPGDSVTLYFASLITAQDALNRNVDNTATVQTAELPDEDAVAGTEAGCPFTPIGLIAIEKTCPTIADGARIGDEITYQVTITNTGDAALVDIDVDETRSGDYDSPFPTALARGESATRTFTSEITPQDALNRNVDNSASVEANDSVLASDIGAEASVECPFEPFAGIEILKACPGAEELADARVDDEISYEITVKNIGDVELSNIVVTDSRDATWSETIPSLARQGQTGDTATVTFTGPITFDDAGNGNVDNTASVTANVGPARETASLVGVAQAETVTASDSATAECPYTAFVDVDIQKACPLADQMDGARAGDAISYKITVKNTGDAELSNLVVTDSRDDSWSETIASLAPGASMVVTFTGNITLDDAAHGNVDNTASVTANVGPAQETASLVGVAQTPRETVSSTATARCAFDPFESVQVTKSCPISVDGARVGDEITYEVTITNGGDVKLTGIAVTDERDGSFDSAFPAELAPGASATRTFTSEITADDAASGNVNNTAHVTAVAGGVSGDSGNGALQSAATGAGATIAVTVSGRVTANCAFVPVVDLDLDKSCPDIATGARVGDEISYEVTITNTGDVTITGIDITDTRDGEFDAPFPAELDPGKLATRTFTSTITNGDAENGNVDNVATVIATATSGNVVYDELTVEASATCDFTPFVDVLVEKHGNGPINAGDKATFTITVSNIGDAVATDVTVNDALPGALDWALDPEVDDCVIAGGVLDCEFDSVAAGASVEISVSAETPSDSCDDLYNIVSIDAANESAGTTANNAASAIITVDCGTVEIVKVICTVHKDHDVAFEVTTPGDETGDDSYESYDGSWCKPLKDVEFTIDGEQLDAPVAVKTGKDGTVSAILPPGDYTITEVSTKASEAFSVVADDTTTVKVFNFTVIEIPAPKPTPEPTETPEVITSLPSTGAGPTSGNDEATWILMVMSVVLCGGAAYALRRRAA